MLRRLFFSIAAIAALLLILAAPASAQQRIALVIGNAAYAKGADRKPRSPTAVWSRKR